MVRPTDSRWLGRWRLMPPTPPLPMPPADGRAPPERRRIARPVPPIAPAVPPRRPSTRWFCIIWRPSSPGRRTQTPWAGASRRGWSATFAATCGAASSPTALRGCDARTVGTTGSWPSPARVGGCAPPATHGAWRRWPRTLPTTSSPTSPSGSGCSPCRSVCGPSCTRRPRWRVPCSAFSSGGSGPHGVAIDGIHQAPGCFRVHDPKLVASATDGRHRSGVGK